MVRRPGPVDPACRGASGSKGPALRMVRRAGPVDSVCRGTRRVQKDPLYEWCVGRVLWTRLVAARRVQKDPLYEWCVGRVLWTRFVAAHGGSKRTRSTNGA